jgi:hypothetical protein
VPVRRTDEGLAFVGPPLVRSGPVDEVTLGGSRVPRRRPGAASTATGSTTGPAGSASCSTALTRCCGAARPYRPRRRRRRALSVRFAAGRRGARVLRV